MSHLGSGRGGAAPQAEGWPPRALALGILAVLLALPWLNFVVWWRSWPAWLLPVVLYFLIRWLLDRITMRHRLDAVEARLAALEEREAVRRFTPRHSPDDDDV